MARHPHPTVLFSHRDNRRAFHSFTQDFHKFVGEIYRMARTAIILGHLDKLTAGLLY